MIRHLMMLAALVATSQAAEIFNGKNLDGWDGDPRLWRVENGVIVGESNATDKKLSANDFLIWKGGEVGDFELTYKARVTGNNSGFQYRSQRIPGEGWRLKGYQMDLHPKAQYLGMLYEDVKIDIDAVEYARLVHEHRISLELAPDSPSLAIARRG